MSLGAAFPDGFKRTQVVRRLVPAIVIKQRTLMDDGKEHEKRFVVVFVDDHTFCFVINTEINAILTRRADVLAAQLVISVHEHGFMDYDSHVDCSRVRRYLTSDVIQQLVEQPTWILGPISDSLKQAIVAAIEASMTIRPNEKKKLTFALAPTNSAGEYRPSSRTGV